MDVTRYVSGVLSESLQSLPQLSLNCCIYKVPENLRKVNEDAYRPLLVSIGPFYYNDPRLTEMRQQKLRYLNSFLSRNCKFSLEYYVQVIRGWEVVARQFYVESLEISGLSSVQFIEMLLVDAVFIIELFLRDCYCEFREENDRIFNKPRMLSEVTRDIGLEENQVPFFILERLYDLAFEPLPENKQPSLLDITYRFFMGRHEAVPKRIADADVKHLVDFLRLCYLPSTLRVQPPIAKQNFEFSKSVSELSEAGVRVVVSNSENILDVKFLKGALEIPRFVVTDATETIFRNIMVFEQCHYYYDSYIIDYFAFLNRLINTPKDVAILVQSGVIEHSLGNNEEVANLFSKMFKETRLGVSNFYYSSICNELNACVNTPWNRLKAIFSHPWVPISVVYAIVILILLVLLVVAVFVR